jgi:hypothetical protein
MSVASYTVIDGQGFRVIPIGMERARPSSVSNVDDLEGNRIRTNRALYNATGLGFAINPVNDALNEFIAQRARAAPDRDPSLASTNHDSAVIVGPRNIEGVPVVAVLPNQQTAGGAGPPVRILTESEYYRGSTARSRARSRSTVSQRSARTESTVAPAVASVAAQLEEGPPPAQRRPRQPRQRSRSRTPARTQTPCAKSVVCEPVGKGLRQCRGAMKGTTPCKALGSALRQCR